MANKTSVRSWTNPLKGRIKIVKIVNNYPQPERIVIMTEFIQNYSVARKRIMARSRRCSIIQRTTFNRNIRNRINQEWKMGCIEKAGSVKIDISYRQNWPLFRAKRKLFSPMTDGIEWRVLSFPSTKFSSYE